MQILQNTLKKIGLKKETYFNHPLLSDFIFSSADRRSNIFNRFSSHYLFVFGIK